MCVSGFECVRVCECSCPRAPPVPSTACVRWRERGTEQWSNEAGEREREREREREMEGERERDREC